MSTQASSPSPFSRLSRLAFPFKPASPSSGSPEPQTEDWYIPYNGPYEPPKGSGRNTDSWGHLVSGWLMENDGEKSGHGYGQVPPRIRALSNASRMTADEHNRKSSRPQTSFIKLDQAGGIGDVPVPARPRRSQEAPVQRRASFASILSLSKQKAASHRQLQDLNSVGTLPDRGRESGDGRARSQSHSHSNSNSNSIPHSQGVMGRPQGGSSLAHSQPRAASASASGFSTRPHPYAYATPAAPPLSASTPRPVQPPPRAKTPKFTVQLLEPLARKPSAPAYLLPASRPSRLSLKASMSTPNLRAATGTESVLPKGKQRWLSAETWCDALFLPRPRFALRVMDGEGGSGRTVSPPPLPMWPPGAEPTTGRPTGVQPKQLKKSQSAVQLGSRPSTAPSPPRPPPVRDDQARAGPSISPQKAPPPEDANAETHLTPYRPKSWALDDLALPSPVPSLAKVLEDGRKLHQDRKAWQQQAAKALDRRAGTFSRARSKSLGNRAASLARNPRTLETLTEATLLGNQKRRPTVHVRVKPPRSNGHTTSNGGGTNTVTGTATATATGTALGTFTSTSQGQTKSRSQHGHSNSLGSTSQGPSEASFMWTPGHGRSRSFGKSALRVVRTTATTAAALCGKNTGSPVDDESEKAHPPLNEKAAAMEEALRNDGTKFIHLRDQAVGDQGQRDNGVVVITPPPDSSNTQTTGNSQHLSPGRPGGVSPTPSTSAEGVGIAISTPLPTPQPGEDVFVRDPIRIPAHPYAQGSASHPYYQRTASRTLIQTNVRSEDSSPSPSGSAGGDSITKHRQPVKHPYSPFKPIQHPFAAITGTSNDAGPGPSTQATAAGKHRPSKHLDARPSPLSSMFAEVSSGNIREILPDEIQYSPYCATPPLRLSAFVAARSKLSHPYGAPTNRTSEWGFAEALNFTMERKDSEDSGVGSSEPYELPPVPIVPELSERQEGRPFRRILDDQDDVVVLSPEREEIGEDGLDPHSRSSSGSGPQATCGRTGISSRSNHTLASSLIENDHAPSSRHGLGPHDRSFNSGRSSPGLVSTQSSPPLSPHLFQSSDLHEFKDLFYNPDLSSTPPHERPPIPPNQSGNIQKEHNTRSVSGLTTLARQLSENDEEMQNDEGFDHVEPMWEALHGGEAGRRPVDVGRERPQMVSKSSSGSGYQREGTQSPMRLPIDADLILLQPVDVVHTDVESSRASSMLEMPLDDNPAHMRVGEIEAVSTPSVYAQPQRFSTHLTEMDYDDTLLSPVDSRSGGTRVVSGESSQPFSSSDATRSSFMTNTSGMSRLSDFPVPPTSSHMSILNAYYRDSTRESHIEERDSSRPGLVREASHATFGGRQQMGEAL
ncbi:hypothetical protein LXA43DRAFT_923810 [Ganoderma leucocontextum]|nr:hypothetical protein LXA43DRAFT_923810 [Ganoderma leucocontextum]